MRKVFTVVQADWTDGRMDDVLPFQHVYGSLEQAQGAVREAAREKRLAMDGPFFNETGLLAVGSDWESDDRTDWTITEAILED